MGPTVLLYRLTGERGRAVASLCAQLGLTPRTVSPLEEGKTLAALLGLPGPQAGPGGAVPGEMLVMAFLDRPLMERFLDAFPANHIPPVTLKAVLTPTNAAWTGPRLYRELEREHKAMGK